MLEEDCNDLPFNDIVKIGSMKRRDDFLSSESDTSEPKKIFSEHPSERNLLG